jgi:hypothetical protein
LRGLIAAMSSSSIWRAVSTSKRSECRARTPVWLK